MRHKCVALSHPLIKLNIDAFSKKAKEMTGERERVYRFDEMKNLLNWGFK
jgi:hypothetical protein